MQGQGSAELLDKITQEAIALPLKIFMYHPPWESVEYVAGRGTRGQDSKGLFHKPSTTSQHMADGRTPRLPAGGSECKMCVHGNVEGQGCRLRAEMTHKFCRACEHMHQRCQTHSHTPACIHACVHALPRPSRRLCSEETHGRHIIEHNPYLPCLPCHGPWWLWCANAGPGPQTETSRQVQEQQTEASNDGGTEGTCRGSAAVEASADLDVAGRSDDSRERDEVGTAASHHPWPDGLEKRSVDSRAFFSSLDSAPARSCQADRLANLIRSERGGRGRSETLRNF